MVDRESTDSVIQPNRNENAGWGYRVLHAVDIFSFLPVPKTDPVSTRRSITGSLILIFIFLAYAI